MLTFQLRFARVLAVLQDSPEEELDYFNAAFQLSIGV